MPVRPTTPTGIGATSLGVALLRAQESRRSDRLFDDPYAQAFVDRADPDRSLIRATQPGPDLVALMAGQVAVRTRLLDDALLTAARQGTRQVVLLGCGMDSRAFRLPWPAGTTVYEADQPDVLAFKSAVLAEQGARPGCDRIEVPLDLCRDWPAMLIDAGFVPDRPTAWLAEGFLYALSPDAADEFLDRVTGCSAPGSGIAFDHVEDSALLRAARAAISPALVDLWQGGPSGDPRAWLRRHGWIADVRDIADVAAGYDRATQRLSDWDGRGWLGIGRRPA
jgi:methyltransferase (TIGR00027 family)